MKIYITTSGRSERQATLKNLPEELRNQVILVVQKKEEKLYREKYDDQVNQIISLPKNINTLSPTRDWIVYDYHNLKKDGNFAVLLDDDLKFDTRRKDEPDKFITSTPKDVVKIFQEIEKELRSGVGHVGVLSREGGNRTLAAKVYNQRMVRVLAYDVSTIRAIKAKFGRLRCMSDFDMTLQLLRAGFPNTILCKWVNGQGSSNAEGGCSKYRTKEVLAESAKGLKKLHSDFVTLVEKETKGAWGGGKRTDVMIQWKKAYASSQR